MNARITIALVILFVVVVLGAVLVAWPSPAMAPIENGETNNGEAFVSENVKVSSPLPGARVPKTFVVSGEARGIWFFEASFPIKVQDSNNEQVGLGIAQAQAEWMTEDFVPFTATVTVSDYAGPATLVLIKDNPSGLPEHADAVEFPIVVQ